MMHKFNRPDNDGYRRLCMRLGEFAEKAEEVLREKRKIQGLLYVTCIHSSNFRDGLVDLWQHTVPKKKVSSS